MCVEVQPPGEPWAGTLGVPLVGVGGGVWLGAFFTGSVVVPFGEVIWAAVTSWPLGHHATNHPLTVVAVTSWPSLRTKVTALTVG